MLAHGTMVAIGGRNPGQYGTVIDLSNVTHNGDVFLTVFASTPHQVQIYSIEFIARIE